MSIGDIIVLGIVAAAVVLAILRIRRKKTGCGCGCDGCTAGCGRSGKKDG